VRISLIRLSCKLHAGLYDLPHSGESFDSRLLRSSPLCARFPSSAYPHRQLLRTIQKALSAFPASLWGDELLAARPLRSSGITHLHSYYGPIRLPLLFSRLPVSRLYDRAAPGISPREEDLSSSDLFLADVLSLLPRRGESDTVRFRPSRAAFTPKLKARPSGLVIFEATFAFTHVTARRLARTPIEYFRQWASRVQFPSPLPSKLQGS